MTPSETPGAGNGAVNGEAIDEVINGGESDGQSRRSSSSGHSHFPPHSHPSALAVRIVDHNLRPHSVSSSSSSEGSNPPGGFDETPFPDAPRGYTLKFVFHRATHLPPADITFTSDPYIHATLILPSDLRRHATDPALTHRTPTVHRTTNPVWDDEWVVANVPPGGCELRCRIYDEDFPQQDDKLGEVSLRIPRLDGEAPWRGIPRPGNAFPIRESTGGTKAYLMQACFGGRRKRATRARNRMRPGRLARASHAEEGGEELESEEDAVSIVYLSVEVLGPTLGEAPNAQVYTVGPTRWIQHRSPLIGRLTGVQVDGDKPHKSRYAFVATDIQFAGPVPSSLYHRYVRFRPIIDPIFAARGLHGKILNRVVHRQHRRIYSYDSSTRWGYFEACSDKAARAFVRLVLEAGGGQIVHGDNSVGDVDDEAHDNRYHAADQHVGEKSAKLAVPDQLGTVHSNISSPELSTPQGDGHHLFPSFSPSLRRSQDLSGRPATSQDNPNQKGRGRHRRRPAHPPARIFTYVLTLDGRFRFTPTGTDLGIDLLSKHTLHSNVEIYIACSGEFFLRPLQPSEGQGGSPSLPLSPGSQATDTEVKPENGTTPKDQHDQPTANPTTLLPQTSSGLSTTQDPIPLELIIDNDSGTYRPDKSILPDLDKFLRMNLPGLAIRTMDCRDKDLIRMKEERKKLLEKARNRT